MVTLKSDKLRNQNLVSAYGKVTFDENGLAVVDDALGENLSKLHGYHIIGEENSSDDTEFTQEEEIVQEEVTSEESIPETKEDSVEQEDDSETEETEETEEDGSEDLSTLNVPQLKKYAKDHGIDVTGLTKRQELLDKIIG